MCRPVITDYFLPDSKNMHARKIHSNMATIFHYTISSPTKIYFLKNMNISSNSAHRFEPIFSFLTEEYPLGFKETGRWF